MSSVYPFCCFIMKLLGFPLKPIFSSHNPCESCKTLRDLDNFPFSYFIFSYLCYIKNSILQQFTLSTRGTNSIRQGPLKRQWQISFSDLENLMWTSSTTFQLRNKLLCSRNKTAAARHASLIQFPSSC